MALTYKDYIKTEKQPYMWCSGCGNGIILRSITEALASLQIPLEKIVIATGIGCWGKADDYFNTHAFHGTHGRALAFATGIKAVRPEVHVLALMGDGDSVTIGGNHFIHAARRNLDVTAIISNNFNYGMTGGQYSATSPLAAITSTSPNGVPEPGFDVCELAVSAGANYVARTTVYHVKQMKKLIEQAISKKGFSMVEVMNACPTHYGRRNMKGGGLALMNYFKEKAIFKSRYDKLGEEERLGYLATGVFVDRDRPDFLTVYKQLNSRDLAGDAR